MISLPSADGYGNTLYGREDEDPEASLDPFERTVATDVGPNDG